MDDRPWMTALEKQFFALSVMRSFTKDASSEKWWQGVKHLLDNPDEFRVHLKSMKTCIDDLPRAETFAWSSEMILAVHRASQSLPPESALTRELLPATCGWWWLEEAIPTMPPDVKAILWSADGDWVRFSPIAFFPTTVERRPVGVDPTFMYHWKFDVVLRDLEQSVEAAWAEAWAYTKPELRAQVLALTRFFLAACVWLQQRILTAPAMPIERHARHRLMREHRLETAPLVKVVQLRRIERPHDATVADPHVVDWACRWIVNGHWRLQPYKESKRKLIYILPHVKGPADKPLRVPTRTVYEVDR